MKIKTQQKQNPTYYYYSSLRTRTQASYSYKKTKRLPRTLRRAGFISLLLIVNLGLFYQFNILSSPKAQSTVASVKAASEEPKPIPPIDEAVLSAEINSVITANPQLDIGVSITDLKNNKNYTYGVENVFIAASIGKLLSATYYLHQVENGQQAMDDVVGGQPARVQLRKMLEESDNPAWRAINNELTKPALQAYAQQRGIKNYNSETNTVTAREVANLLTELYQHKLLNKNHTSFLLESMKNSHEQMQFIRSHVDQNTVVYHKAGWLSDRAHDTAIVENSNRPNTLVIFTKARHGDYDFKRGQTIFSKLTNATNQLFTSVKN